MSTETVSSSSSVAVASVLALSAEDKLISETISDSIYQLYSLANETKDHGWTLVAKDKFVSITQKKVSSSSSLLTRGDGMVTAPPLSILDLIWDTHKKGKYDPLFKSAQRLREIDDQTRIEHHIYNAPPFVSQRDFVVAGRWVIHTNGTIIVTCKSVEYASCGPVRGYVRGDIVHAGFVIRPKWIVNVPASIAPMSASSTSSSSVAFTVGSATKKDTSSIPSIPTSIPSTTSTTSTITSTTIVTGSDMMPDSMLSALKTNMSMECHITFVAQLELRGGIPSMITRQIGLRQPLSIHGIDQYLQSIDTSTIDNKRYIDGIGRHLPLQSHPPCHISSC